MNAITPEIERALIEIAESTIKLRDLRKELDALNKRYSDANIRLHDLQNARIKETGANSLTYFHALNREMQIAARDEECFDSFSEMPKPQCCSHTRIHPVNYPVSIPSARYYCARCSKAWFDELPEDLRANIDVTQPESGL